MIYKIDFISLIINQWFICKLEICVRLQFDYHPPYFFHFES